MLKIYKINVYSILPEFDIFHKLEFDMFMFITYNNFKVLFVSFVPKKSLAGHCTMGRRNNKTISEKDFISERPVGG